MLSGHLNISKFKNICGKKVTQQPQNSYLQSERLTQQCNCIGECLFTFFPY